MRHHTICALVTSSALTLGTLGIPPALATPPTQRFVPVSLADIGSDEDYAADVANIIGAAYSATVTPAEIRGAEDLTDAVPPGASGVEVADILSEELPLSDEAQASVAAFADELNADTHPTEEDPVAASIDDGAQTISVTVTPAELTATQDQDTGELILEVSTMVASLDQNEIETIELIETVLITDPHTGAIRSLELLDTEDYIAAAQQDSTAELQPLPDAAQNTVASTSLRSTPFKTGLSSANKKKVADYALKYALSPNKSYRLLSADCTNFVSQSMRAGGWQWKTGWYQDNRYWWYNSANQTWSWGGAENWYKFALKNSKRTTATTASKLVPGDIVQIKYKGQKVINHSMVVTAKVGNTVYVSFHTRNTKNKKLATIMSQTKGATYFYHRT